MQHAFGLEAINSLAHLAFARRAELPKSDISHLRSDNKRVSDCVLRNASSSDLYRELILESGPGNCQLNRCSLGSAHEIDDIVQIETLGRFITDS